jgi:hypothetical protein
MGCGRCAALQLSATGGCPNCGGKPLRSEDHHLERPRRGRRGEITPGAAETAAPVGTKGGVGVRPGRGGSQIDAAGRSRLHGALTLRVTSERLGRWWQTVGLDESGEPEHSVGWRLLPPAVAGVGRPRPTLLRLVQSERGGSAARALATSRRQSSSAWRRRASLHHLRLPVTPTAAPWPMWLRRALLAYGAEHVSRICCGVRHGPRPRCGFSIGRMSEKGHPPTSGACPG